MTKKSKRIELLKNRIIKSFYSSIEAIQLLKQFKQNSFIESCEAHIKLNINPKNITHQIRSNIDLPHGTGKSKKFGLFIDTQPQILPNNVIIVSLEDLMTQINKNKFDFDLLITTPALMPQIAKFGKILGPKGLMPSPKNGTLTQDITGTITKFQNGQIEYKTDKTGIIHLLFGKINFISLALIANLRAIYNSIMTAKPPLLKGRYIQSFAICTTQSPSLFLDLESFK